MEVKFDTKTTYTVITPVAGVLDKDVTAKLAEVTAQDYGGDSNNFIIDLQYCKSADNTSLFSLRQVHDACYTARRSFVLTGLQAELRQTLQNNDETSALNMAPTMEEAIDIISMEILERDLLSEE